MLNLATITGMITVGISVVTFFQQNRFNRNSVRPIVNVVIGDYENNIYVKLINRGIGPATIKELTCIYDGDVKIKDRETNTLIDMLKQEGATSSIIKMYTDYVEEIEGRTMSPNEEIVLIRKLNPLPLEKNGLRIMLQDMTISVVYQDIYNKKYHEKRKLDFFGRR